MEVDRDGASLCSDRRDGLGRSDRGRGPGHPPPSVREWSAGADARHAVWRVAEACGGPGGAVRRPQRRSDLHHGTRAPCEGRRGYPPRAGRTPWGPRRAGGCLDQRGPRTTAVPASAGERSRWPAHGRPAGHGAQRTPGAVNPARAPDHRRSVGDIVGLLVRYGYLVVFVAILLENLGLPLPGIALLLVGGGLAGAGKLRPGLIVVLAVAGALLGDLVWYALGRWRGRPVLGFLCRLSLNPDTCVGNTERFFLRWGMPTLLIAKFVPGVNTVAPPLMGTLGGRFLPFLAYDTGGAVIFAVVSVGVGYLLGLEIVDRAQAAASQKGAWLGWALGVFGLLYLLWRFALRDRK